MRLTGSYVNIVLSLQELRLLWKTRRRTWMNSAKCCTGRLFFVDKVSYFWGGKSTVIGWGVLTRVTVEGNPITGAVRPFGLDGSGYVAWVFVNAADIMGKIVYGASSQYDACTPISWI
jgi:hypothetical protein